MEWVLELGAVLLSLKGATKDCPHNLVWAVTIFQPNQLTQQALNANPKEPFDSGH